MIDFGLELFAGYFSSGAEQQRRVMANGEVMANGQPVVAPAPGMLPAGVNGHGLYAQNYRDSTALKAPFAALSASYRFLEKTPVTVRIWAGLARATVNTSNSGTNGVSLCCS